LVRFRLGIAPPPSPPASASALARPSVDRVTSLRAREGAKFKNRAATFILDDLVRVRVSVRFRVRVRVRVRG